MSESPIYDPFRENKAEVSVPSRPPASPVSTAVSCELTTVSLKVSEDGPLAPALPLTPQRSSARFGAPSHSTFFCRHNPHPQRVRHFRGINDKPICSVNDVMFGQMPQYCLGRVMTPGGRGLGLQSKTPTMAIGTNSTCLPLDVLTGLQLFPLQQADSPSLKLLTEAWREELQYLTERVGLVGPTTKGSSDVSSSSLQLNAVSSPSPPCSAAGQAGSRDSDGTVRLQLMVIDMLCQILQTESIGDVQTWILTAGLREKEQVISLLCAALAKAPVSDPPRPPEAEQLTVREVQNTPPTPCREDTSRDQASELISNTDSGLQTEDSGLERAWSARVGSRTPRERLNVSRTPKTPRRTLGSPAVCHLNQKVVLRYTKRSLTSLTPPTLTPSAVFQAEWPNYAQQTPSSIIS